MKTRILNLPSTYARLLVKHTMHVNFHSLKDFGFVCEDRWQWFYLELAIIRVWDCDLDTAEDVLDSIPQIMLSRDILDHM